MVPIASRIVDGCRSLGCERCRDRGACLWADARNVRVCVCRPTVSLRLLSVVVWVAVLRRYAQVTTKSHLLVVEPELKHVHVDSTETSAPPASSPSCSSSLSSTLPSAAATPEAAPVATNVEANKGATAKDGIGSGAGSSSSNNNNNNSNNNNGSHGGGGGGALAGKGKSTQGAASSQRNNAADEWYPLLLVRDTQKIYVEGRQLFDPRQVQMSSVSQAKR
jgi:hypothetical protein